MRGLLLIVVFILPAILLICKPEAYTSLAAFLMSCLFLGLAQWLGSEKAEKRGANQANDRWMPQAESAIYRLFTVSDSLRNFKSELLATCKNTEKDMPELKKDENRTIRIFVTLQPSEVDLG